ncbi:MAG: methyl-accepting chemotaxis protein, partial [Lachnospiraceae bacterium]|nr:methyl-accepting chemotaxis protein [Lachnospiraceae bacterium]
MKDMSIRFKILLPVCILGILAILITVYEVLSMKSMQDGTNELQQVGIEALAALDQVSISTQKMGKMAYVYIQLDSEGKEAAWEQIESANTQIAKQLDIARAILTNDGAREGLNAIEAATDNLYNTIRQIKESADSGDTQGVLNIMRNDMNSASTEAEAVINEVIGYNNADIDQVSAYQNMVYVWASVVSTVFLILLIVTFIFTVIIIHKFVVARLRRHTLKIDEIISSIERGEGDLSLRLAISNGDELGRLAINMNRLMETLEHVMQKLNEDSVSLDRIVSNVVEKAANANTNACDVSAVTEELSATMEEIAATVAGVDQNASSVMNELNEMQNATDDIAVYANEMKERATALEESAAQNTP